MAAVPLATPATAASHGLSPPLGRWAAGAREARGAVPSLRGPEVHLALGTASLLAARARRTRRGRRTPRAAEAGGALAPYRSLQMDQDGRRWETSVSRIGPPLDDGAGAGAPRDAWHQGAGRLRVACYEASSITCMALRGEHQLCFGTSSGRIRAVDVETGAKIGEYYVGSHVPSPVNLLSFSEGGDVMVAADQNGGVYAWKARFPGSWGYHCHPDLIMSQEGHRAHSTAVTGLVVSDEMVVSSSSDGSLAFWNLMDRLDGAVIQPAGSTSFLGVPLCLCRTEGPEMGVFVGFKDGSVRKIVMSEGKCSESMTLPPSESGAVTALAFGSGTLIVGFEDGVVKILRPGHDAVIASPMFHLSQVQDLQLISDELFLSSAADGRVGVWNIEDAKALWGFRGLRSSQLELDGTVPSFRNICLAADRQRLLFSGLVINPVTPANTIFIRDWRQSRSHLDELAPACEAILCMDMDGHDAR